MTRLPLWSVGLLQALGLIAYITLVALFIQNTASLIGFLDNSYLAPIIPLSLLVISTLVCALISLSYPIYLVWDRHQTSRAIKVVVYTAIWLFFITILVIGLLAATRTGLTVN